MPKIKNKNVSIHLNYTIYTSRIQRFINGENSKKDEIFEMICIYIHDGYDPSFRLRSGESGPPHHSIHFSVVCTGDSLHVTSGRDGINRFFSLLPQDRRTTQVDNGDYLDLLPYIRTSFTPFSIEENSGAAVYDIYVRIPPNPVFHAKVKGLIRDARIRILEIFHAFKAQNSTPITLHVSAIEFLNKYSHLGNGQSRVPAHPQMPDQPVAPIIAPAKVVKLPTRPVGTSKDRPTITGAGTTDTAKIIPFRLDTFKPK